MRLQTSNSLICHNSASIATSACFIFLAVLNISCVSSELSSDSSSFFLQRLNTPKNCIKFHNTNTAMIEIIIYSFFVYPVLGPSNSLTFNGLHSGWLLSSTHSSTTQVCPNGGSVQSISSGHQGCDAVTSFLFSFTLMYLDKMTRQT